MRKMPNSSITLMILLNQVTLRPQPQEKLHADITDLRSNDLILRFRRGPLTLTLFADGRAIVQGTTDITVARSLYARFVGA
jgi:hypothetical protein